MPDPVTGELSVVHRAQRPDPNRQVYLEDYKQAQRNLAALEMELANATPRRRPAIEQSLNDARRAFDDARKRVLVEDQTDAIEQALTAQPAPAPTPAPTPQIFMGEKTGGINIGATPEYSAAAARKAAPPRPGEVRGGYRFKGGNPKDRSSWEQVK